MYHKNYTYETYKSSQQIVLDEHPIKIESATLSIENWSEYFVTIETNDEIPLHLLYSETTIDKQEVIVLQNGEQRRYGLIHMTQHKCSELTFNRIQAKFRVKPVIHDDEQNCPGELWEAFLRKITVGRSDDYSEGECGCSLDTISFRINGEEWTIKTPVAVGDGVVPVEKAKSKFVCDEDKVLIQAPVNIYDFKEFCCISENIATILSIGVGSVAHIEQFSKRTRTNERILYKLQSSSRRPMGSWGALRQTIQDGIIRRYLEAAYPVYCNDPKWWNITAHWYTNLTMCGEIDGGNFYMALLFDRIYHYLKEKEPDSINEWLQNYTVIAGKRKKNRKRQKIVFRQKLDYLAYRFKVDMPAKQFKEIRNNLVHEGEPDLNYPHNMQVHEACLNALTSILLQMLNYNGGFYERSYAKAKPIFI